MPYSRVVFCDFDGTITAQETFVAVLKRFAPELAAELIPQMYSLKLTLREGVQRILESIPSTCYGDILAFARSQPLRPGFQAFLEFLAEQQIPFVVVSGGISAMVAAALEPYRSLIHALYGVEVDTQTKYFQVRSPFADETELVSKVKIMAQYPAAEHIAIGDSVTDLNMALQADLVFARDRLATYLGDRHKPYVSWDDFGDIHQALLHQWQAKAHPL